MNPTVFTILAWEKELEIKSQAQQARRHGPDVFLPEEPRPQRERRKSIFDLIPWNLGTQPQTPCECPQEAGD
jgi:hypothetical protein